MARLRSNLVRCGDSGIGWGALQYVVAVTVMGDMTSYCLVKNLDTNGISFTANFLAV